MTNDRCEKSVHAAIAAHGVDATKFQAEIEEALGQESIKSLLSLVDHAKADPSKVDQCVDEGDERLVATLGVVKGVCDHVTSDLKAHGMEPSKLLKAVNKGFDELEKEIKKARKGH